MHEFISSFTEHDVKSSSGDRDINSNSARGGFLVKAHNCVLEKVDTDYEFAPDPEIVEMR